MKVLVTGGSGKIGGFVVTELQKGNHEVRVFDVKEPSDAGVDLVKGSITEPVEIERAAEGVDGIIHLAAIPSMMRETPSAEYMNVNVTGTFNVLEAAAKNDVGKVAIASSDSALGFVFSTHSFAPNYFPIDEGHPLPHDIHARRVRGGAVWAGAASGGTGAGHSSYRIAAHGAGDLWHEAG